MSKENQEWLEEQQRATNVIKKINKRTSVLEQQIGGTKTEIVDIRKNFWNDVTVNFDDPDDAVETYVSIKQQAELLSERERTHRHAHQQLVTLYRMKQSPYFGRIDFIEEGEQEEERIYIGIGSFVDELNRFLVYDWRAPISSLYYDYSPGPAEYQTPGGLIKGKMELKRQFIIRNGLFQTMFDTGITIGDDILQEVLGKQASTQMRSIVATIQKEQNRIIRNEQDRLLIVQGVAGSGKTSAALQRVAYLLYRYRESLSSEQMVLFSPNPLFNSYVSTVLPELGEQNMQQTTFQEYLEHQLNDTFSIEDSFSQMEYVLTGMEEANYKQRIEGIRFKATTDFLHIIEHYAASLGREGLSFKDIKFRGRTLMSASRISRYFYTLDSSWSLPNRIQLVADWLLKELKVLARQERNKQWVEEEIELLTKEDYVRVYQKLRRKKQFSEETFNDFEREQELLSIMVVQSRFKPLLSYVKSLQFINIPAVYRNLFADPEQILRFVNAEKLPPYWSEICQLTLERLERLELSYEDTTPYLYLKELIEGFQVNTSIRYVFIDEAQDYSAFQLTFIKRLFPRSKMTVLGDLNQAIYAHVSGKGGLLQLSSLFGNEQTETYILKRSYRSTRPIVEFTRELIAKKTEIEAFNRAGKKPTISCVTNHQELITKITERLKGLLEAGHQTIAVICKSAQESREAYERLPSDLALRLIGQESTSYAAGILVIPTYLAKGVEFDAVIIYNASQSQYGKESERKLFYTACTRAMHELHVYSMGDMSQFISDASSDTYNLES